MRNKCNKRAFALFPYDMHCLSNIEVLLRVNCARMISFFKFKSQLGRHCISTSLTNEKESTSITRGSSRPFGSCNYNVHSLFLENCDYTFTYIVSFANWYRYIITGKSSRFCWYGRISWSFLFYCICI